MAKVSGVKIDFQTGSSGIVYATWNFSKEHLDHYVVKWYYYTGDGVAFSGGENNVTAKNSTYSYPSNAVKVGVKVKPVSKKDRKIKGSKTPTYWWTSSWSDPVYIKLSTIVPPSTPSVPTVNIDRYTLTASLNNIESGVDQIEFRIVKDDTSLVKTEFVDVVYNAASITYTVTPGGTYKVRCRSWKEKESSGWSDYSSNVSTIPPTPKQILECRATSETEVYLNWTKVDNITNYSVQYTDKKSNFNSSPDDCTIKSTEEGTTESHIEISGLESDKQYFFRVRANNSTGSSGWSPYVSTKLVSIPTAPTTWASTTKCILGEKVTLHWTHNSENGREVENSKIEITYKNVYTETDGVVGPTEIIIGKGVLEYEIDTSSESGHPWNDGIIIEWRVKTSNSEDHWDEESYGPYSVLRSITVNAPPSLDITMTYNDGSDVETLTHFPFYIRDVSDRTDQKIIGYYLSIVSNEAYETVDQIGNSKNVNKGDEVYSEYFDISDNLLVELTPSSIDLENNVTYTVRCTITVGNGLSTTKTLVFTVGWTDVTYELDAEIGYDEKTYTATIHPYCIDENEDLVDGISLSVYRREFDGSFTTIMTGIDNLSNTAIEDPHPALDYAKYRIVGIDNATGAVNYYDPPGIPIGEVSAIIQWDEKWSAFDASEEDIVNQVPWSGSLLKLPYNLDVSDKYGMDKSLVNYIGRKHPVSYYGTQLGESSTWSVEVPKDDEDTLYALRRLAIWTGDVYVREPSGSGYWASITVSFSKKHCDVTMPVTLEITRVEGGV